jgi:hypothetical protein
MVGGAIGAEASLTMRAFPRCPVLMTCPTKEVLRDNSLLLLLMNFNIIAHGSNPFASPIAEPEMSNIERFIYPNSYFVLSSPK